MINTIIFDIGRVLVDWEWDDLLPQLFDDEKTRETINRVFFGNSAIFAEFDRGVMDTEDVLQASIKKAPEYEDAIRYAFENMGETITVRDTTIPWIDELKARGFKVYYLSNYSKPMRERTQNKLEFTRHMDGGVFSCDVKMIKPDKSIYKALLDKYSLVPEECIFIDDMMVNVEAAQACGIYGIQFITRKQVIEDMEKLIFSIG